MACDAEIAEIDAFLAEEKHLDGPPPLWTQSYGRDWTLRWGLVDPAGVQRGELAFTIDARLEKPSVVLLTQRRLIHRLDLVPDVECKDNPYGALVMGLPPQVCGSHEHPWDVNREWVRVNGFGELPFRRPTSRALRSIDQMLATVCDAANVQLTTGQRDLRLPDQGELF